MRDCLLAVVGGPHKLSTDSTVTHRWLAVLLEATILRVVCQSPGICPLATLLGCNRNEAKLKLQPHLQAAAILAAIAGAHSSLDRS